MMREAEPGSVTPIYRNVLRLLAARLPYSEVTWAITGSLGFALQGVPVEPHDIDIQTDESGAHEIEWRFHESVTRKVAFSSADKIRSHFGTLSLNGISVEVMGGIQKRLSDGRWEPPVDVALHRRFVEFEGMRLPVLSLSYEYHAYLALGRTERAKLLGRWLAETYGWP